MVMFLCSKLFLLAMLALVAHIELHTNQHNYLVTYR